MQRGINGTINATTGIAPADLLYGLRPEVENEIRLNKPQKNIIIELRRKAKLNCDLVAMKMKERYDKNKLRATKFNEGDLALVERTMLVKGLNGDKLVSKYIRPVRPVLYNDRYSVVSLYKDERWFKGVVASERLKRFKPQSTD